MLTEQSSIQELESEAGLLPLLLEEQIGNLARGSLSNKRFISDLGKKGEHLCAKIYKVGAKTHAHRRRNLNSKLPTKQKVAEETAFFKKAYPDLMVEHCALSAEYGNYSAIIMPKFPGVTLREFLKSSSLELSKKIQLQQLIAKELIRLHNLNIFHHDLKPENIIVDSDKQGDIKAVYIIDFNNASERVEQYSSTEHTVNYISPEIVTKTIELKQFEKSDVFSLGVVFGEIFGGDSNELLHKKNSSEHEANTFHRGELTDWENKRQAFLASMKASPQSINECIRQMLFSDPEERPSLEQIIRILENENKGYALQFENETSVMSTRKVADLQQQRVKRKDLSFSKEALLSPLKTPRTKTDVTDEKAESGESAETTEFEHINQRLVFDDVEQDIDITPRVVNNIINEQLDAIPDISSDEDPVEALPVMLKLSSDNIPRELTQKKLLALLIQQHLAKNKNIPFLLPRKDYEIKFKSETYQVELSGCAIFKRNSTHTVNKKTVNEKRVGKEGVFAYEIAQAKSIANGNYGSLYSSLQTVYLESFGDDTQLKFKDDKHKLNKLIKLITVQSDEVDNDLEDKTAHNFTKFISRCENEYTHLNKMYKGVKPPRYNVDKDGIQSAIIVMPQFPGQSLEKWLENSLERGDDTNAEVACSLVQAIENMHAEGIVHRDLKPDNIIIDGTNVTIIDFGAANNAGLEENIPLMTGTAGYISPNKYAASLNELSDLNGWRVPEHQQQKFSKIQKEVVSNISLEKSDIYSLGIILGQIYGCQITDAAFRDLSVFRNKFIDIDYKTEQECISALRKDFENQRQAFLKPLLDRYGTKHQIYYTIAAMLELEPQKRPSIEKVKQVFNSVKKPSAFMKFFGSIFQFFKSPKATDEASKETRSAILNSKMLSKF